MAEAEPDEMPLVSITPDGSYSPEFRQRCVAALGEDGAWLATSVLHYGWRTQYDLARGLAETVIWGDDDHGPLGPLIAEYQIVRDLQVQGHMYAAAEQLASLVEAIRAHEQGEDFFDVYVARSDLHQRVDAVRDLPRETVAVLLGAPSTIENMRDDLLARGVLSAPGTTAGLDLLDIPTTDVGGLLIPRSVTDRALLERMWDHINGMLDGVHRNLQELSMMVDRPQVSGDVRPQSLREVDNSFRHGLRLLFHRAVPTMRVFRALEIGEGTGTHHVDFYLPRVNETVRFATVACSPERTAAHIETTRMLCLRIGQVVRGFLGRVAFDNSGLLISAASLTLGGRTDAQRPPSD